MDESPSQFPLHVFRHLHDRYNNGVPTLLIQTESISMMIQQRDLTLHSSSKSCLHAARAEIFYSGITHVDLSIQICMFIYYKHKPILLVYLVLIITRCKSAALI
jgi:hypothetical protein